MLSVRIQTSAKSQSELGEYKTPVSGSAPTMLLRSVKVAYFARVLNGFLNNSFFFFPFSSVIVVIYNLIPALFQWKKKAALSGRLLTIFTAQSLIFSNFYLIGKSVKKRKLARKPIRRPIRTLLVLNLPQMLRLIATNLLHTPVLPCSGIYFRFQLLYYCKIHCTLSLFFCLLLGSQ